VSLAEVTLLLVFLLLSLLAAATGSGPDPGGETIPVPLHLHQALTKLKSTVDEFIDLDRLELIRNELDQEWTRLINAELVDLESLELTRLIEVLLAENRRPRDDLEELKIKLVAETDRADQAESKLKDLGVAAGTGGTDPGSCWKVGDGVRGRSEPLLDITLGEELLEIDRAWPSHREHQLAEYGLVPDAILTGKVTQAQFEAFAYPVLRRTVEKDCRFVARVFDNTVSKDAYKHQLELVEKYFYPSKQ
jgi:hypothetical protein